MNTRLIRLRRSLYSLAAFFFRHLVFFFLIFFFGTLLVLGKKTKAVLTDAGLGGVDILTFFRPPKQILENTGNRTNFLILGVRGVGDDSPDLTDTMLVVSYSHSDNQASLISIPRDLWVNSLKTKINSVYHYGRFRESRGGGIQLAQSAVLETLGLPVHYTAVVDFSLFKQAIDLVDGVTVDVATAFTDSEFPIEGKENALPVSARYETISFAKGPQLMDGALALKFVRSRHAPGDEGTDIARDRRQQLVIGALIQKIKSPRLFLSTRHLISLYRLVNDHLETNLTPSIYPALVRLAFDSYRHPPEKIALSYLPDENGVAILENPPISSLYQNQWVLIARDNNWPALAQYLQNKLEE